MGTPAKFKDGIAGPVCWSLRLLGGFELRLLSGSGGSASLGKRERALLAYLALSPNGRQPRRKLTTLLWGDAADETTLDNLRTCMWRLRKALDDTEHHLIVSDGDEIVLKLAALDVDVAKFRRFAAGPGLSALESAANLYGGGLLDGLDIESEEFESWRRAEGVLLKEQAVDVLKRLMTTLTELGESQRAVETGLRILQLDPLDETAVRQLMRLYNENGRRGAAVEIYRALAETLRMELNAQPRAETRAVFAEIAASDKEAVALPGPASSQPFVNSVLPDQAFSGASAVHQPIPARRSWVNWTIAGGLAACVFALLFFFPFTAGVEQQNNIQGAKRDSPENSISLAVLPFVNLSGDSSQEFFSDGVTEEITSTLGKVPNLRVVARTSAFQFKTQSRDIQSIGQQLHATHLIEGSVRKEGNRVRITAQLILADNGVQMWSESYDRELAGVFAIQQDIARAIAAALRAPLGLKPDETLVNNRVIDSESYQQYLLGKAALLRGGRGFADVLRILEPLVARNPNYAPAWGKLAFGYWFAIRAGTSNASPEEAQRVRDVYLPKLREVARRAVELDPTSIDGIVFEALAQTGPKKLAQIEDAFRKALSLDPYYPDALMGYSGLLLMVGRVKEGLAVAQQLHDVEPFIPLYDGNVADALWLDGQNEAAIAKFKDNFGRVGAGSEIGLARTYASLGRYKEAADTLSHIPAGAAPAAIVAGAERLLRSAPAKASSPKTLPLLGQYAFVYLHIGAPERSLEYYEKAPRILQDVGLLWHPSYAPARKMERFKTIVREAGLVDYWRERGWPAVCHPAAGDNFACE